MEDECGGLKRKEGKNTRDVMQALSQGSDLSGAVLREEAELALPLFRLPVGWDVLG